MNRWDLYAAPDTSAALAALREQEEVNAEFAAIVAGTPVFTCPECGAMSTAGCCPCGCAPSKNSQGLAALSAPGGNPVAPVPEAGATGARCPAPHCHHAPGAVVAVKSLRTDCLAPGDHDRPPSAMPPGRATGWRSGAGTPREDVCEPPTRPAHGDWSRTAPGAAGWRGSWWR